MCKWCITKKWFRIVYDEQIFLYFEKWRNVAFEIALLTEPGPPKAIEVINVGQRIISLNITDTDTP